MVDQTDAAPEDTKAEFVMVRCVQCDDSYFPAVSMLEGLLQRKPVSCESCSRDGVLNAQDATRLDELMKAKARVGKVIVAFSLVFFLIAFLVAVFYGGFAGLAVAIAGVFTGFIMKDAMSGDEDLDVTLEAAVLR